MCDVRGLCGGRGNALAGHRRNNPQSKHARQQIDEGNSRAHLTRDQKRKKPTHDFHKSIQKPAMQAAYHSIVFSHKRRFQPRNRESETKSPANLRTSKRPVRSFCSKTCPGQRGCELQIFLFVVLTHPTRTCQQRVVSYRRRFLGDAQAWARCRGLVVYDNASIQKRAIVCDPSMQAACVYARLTC